MSVATNPITEAVSSQSAAEIKSSSRGMRQDASISAGDAGGSPTAALPSAMGRAGEEIALIKTKTLAI